MTCLRCGHCCISATFILGEITKDNMNFWKDKAKWLNLHRCDTATRNANGKTYFEVKVPFLCANLDIDPKTHKYRCIDYKNRPESCQAFNCDKAKK